MKMCMGHWEDLKNGIKKAGVFDLVPSSGEEALKMMVNSMVDDSLKNFDPLMTAHNMIFANALELAGLDLMGNNEDGTEKCPICYLRVPEWIGFSVEGTMAYYERLKGCMS